jgi:hypothetical protein
MITPAAAHKNRMSLKNTSESESLIDKDIDDLIDLEFQIGLILIEKQPNPEHTRSDPKILSTLFHNVII